MTDKNKQEREVLPCPCCGSAAFHTWKTDDGPHYLTVHHVYCSNQQECGLKLSSYGGKEAAVEKWNRRAALSRPPAGHCEKTDGPCDCTGARAQLRDGCRNWYQPQAGGTLSDALKLTRDETRSICRDARSRCSPSDPVTGVDYVQATLRFLESRAVLARSTADASNAATGQGLTDKEIYERACAGNHVRPNGWFAFDSIAEIRALLAAPAAPAPFGTVINEGTKSDPAPAAQADKFDPKINEPDFMKAWPDIQKAGYDYGWLGIGLASWRAARQQSATPAEPTPKGRDPMHYTGGAFIRYVHLPDGVKLEHVNGDTWRVTVSATADAASDVDKRDEMAHTLECAVENMRLAGELTDAQIEARWRLAYKLAEYAKDIRAAMSKQAQKGGE